MKALMIEKKEGIVEAEIIGWVSSVEVDWSKPQFDEEKEWLTPWKWRHRRKACLEFLKRKRTNKESR